MHQPNLRPQLPATLNAPVNLKAFTFRTAEHYFTNLEDWDYRPNYTSSLKGYEGLRLHYLDEGKKDAHRTIICLHGYKSWGYAFRKAIPYFLKQNFRVIVPDLYGFGRSDKPANEVEFSFEYHRNSIIQLIEELKLDEVYLAGFDLGGWIAATLPLHFQDRIKGLMLGNTSIYSSKNKIWPGFHLWKCIQNTKKNPNVIDCFFENDACLTDAQLAGFKAPFPDFRYKAGLRSLPNLIPECSDAAAAKISSASLEYLRTDWSGSCVCIAGLKDPIFGTRTMQPIKSAIRGSQPLIKLDNAGLFVFEHVDDFLPSAIEQLKVGF